MGAGRPSVPPAAGRIAQARFQVTEKLVRLDSDEDWASTFPLEVTIVILTGFGLDSMPIAWPLAWADVKSTAPKSVSFASLHPDPPQISGVSAMISAEFCFALVDVLSRLSVQP